MIRLIDRLLLLLYSLAIGAVAVFMIVIASGGLNSQGLHGWLDNLRGDWPAVQLTVIIVSAVLLLISIRFLILSIRRSGNRLPSINQRTDHGDIRISVETVENLALKAASRTRGVKDLKARVRVAEAGISILIRAFVDGEGSIPALSEEIQRNVTQQVDEATGIPVAEVSVYIANVTQAPTSFKSRVE